MAFLSLRVKLGPGWTDAFTLEALSANPVALDQLARRAIPTSGRTGSGRAGR